MSEQCGNCRFWMRGDDVDGEGQCHRHAPPAVNFYAFGAELLRHLTTISWRFASDDQRERDFAKYEDAAGDTFAVWIRTDESEWCGDYELGRQRQ